MVGHACPLCGCGLPAGQAHLWDEEDDNLRAQAADASPEVRELIRILRRRLKTEDAATDQLSKDLRATYQRVIQALEQAAQNPSRSASIAILNANMEELGRLLEATGLVEARANLSDHLRQIVDAANASAEVVGLPAGIVRVDGPALRAFLTRAEDTFWQGKLAQPAAQIIREGLDRALTVESLPKTIETIARQLDTSLGRAATAARTEIAQFDRRVNLETAMATGLRQWLYLGSLDGLTRPFCRPLVNQVVNFEQMQQLDNRQIPNPLISGGGYNCRHRWVVVSPALVERRSMSVATDATVRAANAGAARRRAA